MLSSTLFPKIHRNHMFPMRWNQPPWRNIELTGAYHSCSASITQAVVGLIGTA